LFEKKRAGMDRTDYIRLVDMDHKWQRDRPYYNAGMGIIALVKHPATVTVLTLGVIGIIMVLAYVYRGPQGESGGTSAPSVTGKSPG
jgi:hypothetical protein